MVLRQRHDIFKNWVFHQRKKHVCSILWTSDVRSKEQIVCRKRKEDNSCCVRSFFLRPEATNSRRQMMGGWVQSKVILRSQLDNELIEVSVYSFVSISIPISERSKTKKPLSERTRENVHLNSPAPLSPLSRCIFFLFSLHLWQPTHHALPASGIGLTLWHGSQFSKCESNTVLISCISSFGLTSMRLSTVASATRFSISKGDLMWHTPSCFPTSSECATYCELRT